MSELISNLSYYLTFPFVQYALIVGILIAFCSSLLGVPLVLKRYSYIGDGLSHVAFTAMAISTIFKLTNNNIVVYPVTIIVAILLIKTSQNRKINGDALIAMISVGSLAIGYLLISLFSKSANISSDVCSALFGSTSILTLKSTDVLICFVMSLVVIGLFIVFYHKIFAVTFDENFASATGMKVELYNIIIAVITAIIIVLAMNLVGSLLVSALIIFPALSSMRIFKSFKGVIICSSIISVICTTVGILISILASTPVGPTIVAIDIVVFLIFYILEMIRKGR